ncbi:uncharacterized protein LOC112349389 isoform X1 [Selaginella moellendorffii]|uniref:uncharacterized protein LOC112349389 isoform X1 n=1 Tax=Selaginella moellendorffii TaxID=88036 RepID=UPI000D1C25EA|nr:uncharacterized protein LOC112349389 isoform X1 [Selaginella moellendorffii]|eukprot:XP_024539500.1 uncharacterized protein LOC112349389 isoform X1 [Selaginella moellendorffii]
MAMDPPKTPSVGLDRAAVDRKLSAPKGEIEKAASARRQSFMKAPHEKPAMQYDADVLLRALCKPWEMGGHTHDFLLCHRSARSTDLYKHYETDKYLIKVSSRLRFLESKKLLFSPQKHEKMVAEKVAWNRQRKLREDMLHLLTRLHSIEKQRRRFIGLRIIRCL